MSVVRHWGRSLALVALLLTAYLGVSFAQVWRTSRADEVRRTGAIVVLGAAQYDGRPSVVLRARLDHAAELYHAGIAPVVVVTGGRQPGDRFTEARTGDTYLQGRGVPPTALRLEVDGTNTWESLAATARFLRREGIDDVVLVSSDYHSYRLRDIAGEVGLEAAVSPAPEPWTSPGAELRALLRETGAVALGRVVGYRRLTNLDRRLRDTLP